MTNSELRIRGFWTASLIPDSLSVIREVGMSYKSDKSDKENVRRKFRAIIFDVDGTLVAHDPDALPTPRVAEAVRRAQEAGFIVSAATGRLKESFETVNQVVQMQSPVIIEGGARLYDPVAKKDVWCACIEAETAQRIAIDFLSRRLPFAFAADDKVYNSPALIAHKGDSLRMATRYKYLDRFGRVRHLFDRGIRPVPAWDRVSHFISFPLREAAAEELRRDLHAHTSINVSVNSVQVKGMQCVFLTHLNGTKQHGVIELARHIGVDTHDMIGVGDQEIDYPLLMACGLKVAMGNAVQALKDIADYVAPSVEEDGAAEVIERFLLSNQPARRPVSTQRGERGRE